ncbi:MAG: MmgE/PrpD family protein [Candidatus Tectomicrobia bacterium]|nr:MmgE/PrpD family protein [Candidatus Tectomicrobia bacterium]
MTTESIAQFVEELEFEKVPSYAVRSLKECVLDALGVGLIGSTSGSAKIAIDHVRELGGNPQSGVFAAGFKTSAPQAAFANGIMIHAIDYDDISQSWPGHPSAVLLPVSLSLGQMMKISGKELLESYVAGWETGARISAGARYKLLDIGWHAQSVLGTFAATAAAAKVLKLDRQQIRRAIGIAGSETGGLSLNVGTDTKPLHAGNSAKNGVVAALLAQAGFTAHESILESPRLGFCEVFGREKCDVDRLTMKEGQTLDLVNVGARLKPYASCGATHACIDAMIEIVRSHDFNPDEVAEIVAETAPMVGQYLRYHRPQTGLEGKFSLEFCLVAALLNKGLPVGVFTDEYVSSSLIQELVETVKFFNLPGAPEGTAGLHFYPQSVVVTLKDGRTFRAETPSPKGSPGNPMAWEEVVSKFRDCAASVLSAEAMEHIIAIVRDLENVEDISELGELVTFDVSRG